MVRTYAYSANFNKEVEKLFRKAIFLGEGHNGIVYELPGDKALKIFTDKKVCREEAKILCKVKKSKYFPKIYTYDDYYILREKVDGKRLDHYIKEKGLTKNLTNNLYNLIREFKKLKFTKLDARCRDIYVNEDEKVMLIDPKQCYRRKVDFPRHLMKGLSGIGVLEQFLDYVKEIDSKTAELWREQYNKYWKGEIKQEMGK